MSFNTDIIETVDGTLTDYKKLAEYHYRSDRVFPYVRIYKLRPVNPHLKHFPDPLAVIVYRPPISILSIRSRTLPDLFRAAVTLSDYIRITNENVMYLARLIVHPNFRRLGLGTKLVTETVRLLDKPYVETLIPLDNIVQLFQNAKFHLYPSKAPPWYRQFVRVLDRLGLTDQALDLPNVVHRRIEELYPVKRLEFERSLIYFLQHFKRRAAMPDTIERTRFFLSKIPYPQAYLLFTAKNAGIPTTELFNTVAKRSNKVMKTPV